MRKIYKITAALLIAVLILAMQISFTYAEIQFTKEEKEYSDKPLAQELAGDYGYYLCVIEGEEYFISNSNYHNGLNMKYKEEEYKFFSKIEYLDYIWAGDRYMARNDIVDSADSTSKTIMAHNRPVKFYDKDFNLLHEQLFGDQYIGAIGYYNGAYYCFLEASTKGSYVRKVIAHSKIVMSTDMINWTDVERDDLVYNGYYIPSYAHRTSIKGTYISLDGIRFSKVASQTIKDYYFNNYIGPWIIRSGNVSKDGIYYIPLPEGSVQLIYEYGDDLIFEYYESRYRAPKQQIYDELNRRADAPYVMLNDQILGFEEPPAVEDGRILVPMRFLFEQMGDSVSWDDATQTATVTGDKNNVAFSVDNAVAKVNGASKSMDVPARLVNDKTMVPLRFLSENLGYDVKWDESTNCAIITTEN